MDADLELQRAAVLEALEWCRQTVSALAARGRELRAQHKRDEAAACFADVRMVAWSATELVAWLTPWDSEARRLLQAVQSVRKATPRVHGTDPDQFPADPMGLLAALPSTEQERGGESPAYDQWQALCELAGLTDREAEAVLLVDGMGYGMTDAANIIGVKRSALEWQYAGGRHKLARIIREGDTA